MQILCGFSLRYFDHSHHERELRVVINDSPTKTSDDEETWTFDYKMNPESGRLVPIDVGSLVRKIYVAPTSPGWFRKLVESVTSKYGLSIPIAVSEMDKPPTF